MHEAQLHTHNSFVTLTFNDESLWKRSDHHYTDEPIIPGSLDIPELQRFLKRLRDRIRPTKIRFYACGEYGEKFLRPHYHLCIFGWEPPDKELHNIQNGVRYYRSPLLDKTWGNGFTLTGDVTFQSAAYVARYIMKKINGDLASSHYETYDPVTGELLTLKPEFTTMSRGGKGGKGGIGKQWLEHYKDDVFPHDYVIVNGRKVRPPKYYDRLYEVAYPSDMEKIKAQRERTGRKHKANNTNERLAVREKVVLARLKKLPRTYENDD